MKIELTPDEARVLMGFIDTTLRAKGVEALDAAALFKLKLLKAEQEENDAKAPPLAVVAG